MVGEDAGDGLVDFGEPDGAGVEDLLDGEVESAVAGEQRPDPQTPFVVGVRLVHEDSGRSVIPGRSPLANSTPGWSPARCSPHLPSPARTTLRWLAAAPGPTASRSRAPGAVERIASRPDREGRLLGDDQAAALAKVAVSGRQVDVLVGPAGAGKTTAMNALRRAWEREHGTGSVVGLAPSAVAAQVLADDLGIGTENTAKWLQNHLTTGETFHAGHLVIVTKHRWPALCRWIESLRWRSRRERKCCWSGTTPSSSPSMPAGPSSCSCTIGTTRPSSSMSTASPTPGRRQPPRL